MKKLVKESLYEAIKTNGFEGGNSFGEEKCMKIVEKYFPFLPKVEFDDLEPRGTKDDPAYGQDEQYSKWDQLTVITGDKYIDESGLSLYLIQDFDSDQIYAKFYNDTVNYNGYGEANDEYTSELDPIPVEDWDEERYKSLLKDIKENGGMDDEDDDEDEDDMWESSSLAECKNCQEELDEHEVEEGSGYCAKCRQFDKQVYDRNKNNPNRKI